MVDAGRNGLCAGLVRSLVIRYCRSLCVAPGLAITPRDLSPIEVVKIQQQVAVHLIWSSMAKAMIDKSEMPGAASALCQGSGLEGLENNITIIIVIVSIVNYQYNHLCYHAHSMFVSYVFLVLRTSLFLVANDQLIPITTNTNRNTMPYPRFGKRLGCLGWPGATRQLSLGRVKITLWNMKIMIYIMIYIAQGACCLLLLLLLL